MTRVFDHSLLNGLAMSVGSPKIYNYPSDLSDQEKQKWRDMVDFVPGFAELAAIKIDINMEVQPASPNLLIAQNFFNDIVQVSPYHDLETLKQPGGGFEPTIVELSLHSGHKIVFDRRAQQVVISGPQENITRIQSFTELLKNNTNGWDALPIILEPAIAAKSATEEVIFELAEEPKAAEAKRSPHAFSLDEVEEIVQKGFSEAKKDVSKASLVQQYETLIENINALKGKSVFEVGSLPDNPSFDLIHARIALLKDQLVDKPAQATTENNQNRSTTGYTRHIAGGNATRRLQTRKSLAQETASQTDNVAEPLQSHTPATWGWANDWKVTQAEPNPFASIPIDKADAPAQSGNRTASRRLNNQSNWVTRNWQEAAIGAAAGLTKTFILAGAGLTGPAGLALSLGLTGLIGGLNRMRRTHKQRKQLQKEGKPLPETSKYFWLKEFGKGAAVSAVTAGLFMGAAELLEHTDIGHRVASSFKNTFFGATDLANAAEGTPSPASPTSASPTGVDPASLTSALPTTVQQILEPEQIGSLPESLQKLANTTDPQKLVKFCNEASSYLYSHNVGVHDDASKAAKQAASDLIEMGLRVAKEKGITGSAVNQLFANDSFFSLHGIGGRDVDTVHAAKSAISAKDAVNKYGKKAIGYIVKHGLKM